MDIMEKRRTGSCRYFPTPDSGWLSCAITALEGLPDTTRHYRILTYRLKRHWKCAIRDIGRIYEPQNSAPGAQVLLTGT